MIARRVLATFLACTALWWAYGQNVGIGTNTPQSRLHVDGAAPADANAGQLRISESTNGRFLLIGRAAGYGFIQTHNSQPLAINPLGNFVGIGTTAPQQELHLYRAAGNVDLRVQSGASAIVDFGTGTVPAGNAHFVYGYGALPLVFATNGQERMRITATGNVGIGTTTPPLDLRLDVAGKTRTKAVLIVTAADPNEGGQVVLAAAGDYTAIGENCNSWSMDVVNLPPAGPRFRIFRGSLVCSNGLEVITALFNGNVGIDIITPLARLDVRKTAGHSGGTGTPNDAPTTAIITAGATARQNDWPNGWGGGLSTWDICGSVTYMNAYPTRSDASFKTAITPLSAQEGFVERFMRLRPVTYRFRESFLANEWDKKRLHYGFIANEVEELFPDIVVNAGTDPSIPRGLEYDAFISMLVEMVQRQERRIQQLEERIAQLEKALQSR